jgi:hypothetical protein
MVLNSSDCWLAFSWSWRALQPEQETLVQAAYQVSFIIYGPVGQSTASQDLES